MGRRRSVEKRQLGQSNGIRRIGYKPGLPMVKKRLMAKGIITRMESRIKNKENFQFKSRVLVHVRRYTESTMNVWITHVAEKMPNAWSMSKKNIIQLSVKHHENMIRETAAWRYVGSSNINWGDLGVCAVDGSGSESSWIVSASSLFLCVLMDVMVSPGVPGTELEEDDKESEWRSE